MALPGFPRLECRSVGHKYPTDPTVLKSALDLRGPRVSEPWVSTYFTIKEMEEQTIQKFHQQLDFIKAMGGPTWSSPGRESAAGCDSRVSLSGSTTTIRIFSGGRSRCGHRSTYVLIITA